MSDNNPEIQNKVNDSFKKNVKKVSKSIDNFSKTPVN